MRTLPEYHKTVAFADTDMAGVVHFSRILCYVEEAEHLAMAEMEVSVMSKSGGFPKVHVDCDYRSPLRFQDEASVKLDLVKVGGRSLTWRFAVRVGETLSAKGSFVTAFIGDAGESADISEGDKASLLKYVSAE